MRMYNCYILRTKIIVNEISLVSALKLKSDWVGGVAQWLECRSLAGGLSLIYA